MLRLGGIGEGEVRKEIHLVKGVYVICGGGLKLSSGVRPTYAVLYHALRVRAADM